MFFIDSTPIMVGGEGGGGGGRAEAEVEADEEEDEDEGGWERRWSASGSGAGRARLGAGPRLRQRSGSAREARDAKETDAGKNGETTILNAKAFLISNTISRSYRHV